MWVGDLKMGEVGRATALWCVWSSALAKACTGHLNYVFGVLLDLGFFLRGFCEFCNQEITLIQT